MRVNSGPPPPRRESPLPRMGRGGATSANRVYVGNLAWGVDDLALETLFSEQGKVVEAKVVYDRESGRSRGFGFVTYSSAEEVNSAIETLNGVVSIFNGNFSMFSYVSLDFYGVCDLVIYFNAWELIFCLSDNCSILFCCRT